MGLIYGKVLPLMVKGYRTKLNDALVCGGVASGEIEFGDVLVSDVKDQYKKISASTEKPVGILLATNIKMPSVYPADSTVVIKTKVGEGINVLKKGHIALKLATGQTVVAGGDAYTNTSGEIVASGTAEFKIGKFTGEVEGLLAEVNVDL